MGYTIIKFPKLGHVVVHGATGDESRPSPIPYELRPVGNLLYSDLSGLYGDDQGKRIEVWATTNDSASSTDIFIDCPYIRGHKERLIRYEGAARLATLANPYEPAERETWPYQRAEALAWVADNTAPTPYCDIIAAGRGIPREYFIPKVLENSNLFSQASASILGQQQALIDHLWREPNFTIFWGITWP